MQLFFLMKLNIWPIQLNPAWIPVFKHQLQHLKNVSLCSKSCFGCSHTNRNTLARMLKWQQHLQNGWWYLCFDYSISSVTNQCLPIGEAFYCKWVCVFVFFSNWKLYLYFEIGLHYFMSFIAATILLIIGFSDKSALFYVDMQQ